MSSFHLPRGLDLLSEFNPVATFRVWAERRPRITGQVGAERESAGRESRTRAVNRRRSRPRLPGAAFCFPQSRGGKRVTPSRPQLLWLFRRVAGDSWFLPCAPPSSPPGKGQTRVGACSAGAEECSQENRFMPLRLREDLIFDVGLKLVVLKLLLMRPF